MCRLQAGSVVVRIIECMQSTKALTVLVFERRFKALVLDDERYAPLELKGPDGS